MSYNLYWSIGRWGVVEDAKEMKDGGFTPQHRLDKLGQGGGGGCLQRNEAVPCVMVCMAVLNKYNLLGHTANLFPRCQNGTTGAVGTVEGGRGTTIRGMTEGNRDYYVKPLLLA